LTILCRGETRKKFRKLFRLWLSEEKWEFVFEQVTVESRKGISQVGVIKEIDEAQERKGAYKLDSLNLTPGAK
jgi:hypothetical protein